MTPVRPPFVQLEAQGPVLLLTLHRPEKANAYHTPMLEALETALQGFERNPALRVLLITGSGQTFCGGADLHELRQRTHLEGLDLQSGTLFDRLAAFSKPTIAALNGPAVGGGCELALACDLRIGCPNAWLSLPELSHGLIPAAGGARRLTALVGASWARAVILAGRRIEPEQALSSGLFLDLVPAELLLEHSLQVAQTLATLDPLAVRLVRQVIDAQSNSATAHPLERVSQALLYTLAQKG